MTTVLLIDPHEHRRDSLAAALQEAGLAVTADATPDHKSGVFDAAVVALSALSDGEVTQLLRQLPLCFSPSPAAFERLLR